MLDSIKVGNFIMGKRKSLGMTQQQLADKLKVSFQAISKWENGTTYPNIEILRDLAIVLDVSVDEILAGSERDAEGLSYSKAGIDITYTDTIKREMAKHLETKDDRVLNGLGPFASLYDIKFPEIENPVLVLKSEEPGSKQKLAMEYGYSLVRLLMDKMPQIKLDKIDGLTFIEQIMKPHTPYYRSIKDLFDKDVIHGMAHITGGGIEGNLCRVIPDGLSAKIDLSKIKILDIFKYIRNNGNISDEEMLRTFNCGVGFNIVTDQKDKVAVMQHVSRFYNCYEIGVIESGDCKVKFENRLNWL